MKLSVLHVRIVVSGLVAAAALSVRAAVFDDARVLFNGAEDLNGDGIFQQGELREVLHASDSAHAFHGTKYQTSSADQMTITREDVVCPYRNVTMPGVSCLSFPHPATTNELVAVGGVTYPVVTVKPNFLSLPNFLSDYGTSQTCSTYSAVLRFRYDEPVSHVYQQQSVLAHFGFKWASGGGSGLAVCLTRTQEDPDNNARRLQFYCGSTSATDGSYQALDAGNGWFKPYIYPGSWVDLAIRVRGQDVTYAYTWNDVKDGTCVATNRHIRFWTKTISANYNPAILPDCRWFRLGGESATTVPLCFTNGCTTAVYNNNALKCFRGCVQKYAFWTRDLSDEEMLEALGEPRPGQMRIGLADGSAAEFSSQTNRVHADGFWQHLTPTLAAKGSQVEVKYTADAASAGLPQYLRVFFAARPAGQTLPSVTVNGTVVTCVSNVKSSRADWYVPANVIVAGTNTITLTRQDENAAALTIDALELCGSWQLGDPTVAAENTFSHESYSTNAFHLTDGNLRHFKRGLSGGGVNRFDEIHFNLPQDVGGACDGVYAARFEGWYGTTEKGLSLYANDQLIETKVSDGNELLTWKIPARFLRAGPNVLRLYKVSADGWVNVQMHRFTLRPKPRGMVLLFR